MFSSPQYMVNKKSSFCRDLWFRPIAKTQFRGGDQQLPKRTRESTQRRDRFVYWDCHAEYGPFEPRIPPCRQCVTSIFTLSNSVQLFLKAVIPAGIGGEDSLSSSALPPSMEVAGIQAPWMARSACRPWHWIPASRRV